MNRNIICLGVLIPLLFSCSLFDSSDKEKSFFFDNVTLAADNKLYFLNNSDNTLVSWDLGTDTVNQEESYPDSVVAMINVSSNLYISSGPELYKYYSDTKINDLIYTAPNDIDSVFFADNFIVISESGSSWSTYHLFSYPEFEETDVNEYCYNSSSFAFHNGLNRIYHLKDGTSPDELSYFEIDVINSTLEDSVQSGYRYDREVAHPVKLFSDNLIITGSGEIYDAETLHIVGNIGYFFKDIVFHETGIYILTNEYSDSESCSSEVIKLSSDSPYNYLETVAESNKAGRKLILNDNQLIIITQNRKPAGYSWESGQLEEISVDSINL